MTNLCSAYQPAASGLQRRHSFNRQCCLSALASGGVVCGKVRVKREGKYGGARVPHLTLLPPLQDSFVVLVHFLQYLRAKTLPVVSALHSQAFAVRVFSSYCYNYSRTTYWQLSELGKELEGIGIGGCIINELRTNVP
ncbi:hypothetical protein L6164_024742 [Bauhinia variegata]|uniref:Uncharacterized protein n=1 Tax=Bauhinia variegata TaxID=167791 RepID=A0ACB9LYE1_BAUVA|nr:hypothetical protein L6164_024742 [Bauhinia variegata]